MTPREAIAVLRAAITSGDGHSAEAAAALTTLEPFDPWQAETLWKVLAPPAGVGSRHNASRVLDLIERAVERGR